METQKTEKLQAEQTQLKGLKTLFAKNFSKSYQIIKNQMNNNPSEIYEILFKDIDNQSPYMNIYCKLILLYATDLILVGDTFQALKTIEKYGL